MQSFKTQAHQRNYQGNVILFPVTQSVHARCHKGHGLVIAVMVLVMVVTSSLLGIMTVHNQQLKQQIKTRESQVPVNTQIQTNDEDTLHRGKALPSIPISGDVHETHPIPLVK